MQALRSRSKSMSAQWSVSLCRLIVDGDGICPSRNDLRTWSQKPAGRAARRARSIASERPAMPLRCDDIITQLHRYSIWYRQRVPSFTMRSCLDRAPCESASHRTRDCQFCHSSVSASWMRVAISRIASATVSNIDASICAESGPSLGCAAPPPLAPEASWSPPGCTGRPAERGGALNSRRSTSGISPACFAIQSSFC
eukprot:7786498-Alexandrium_andersonii.AAC.1